MALDALPLKILTLFLSISDPNSRRLGIDRLQMSFRLSWLEIQLPGWPDGKITIKSVQIAGRICSKPISKK
jgi:hypothetical protein